MRIQIRRLHPDAVVPTAQHPGDAGADLVAVEGCVLAPGARAAVATGLALAIPEGFAGFVLPRSGLASRHGITCANAPGLIDAGYRGEVKVVLVNLDHHDTYTVRPGDRIAQLVIVATPAAEFDEVGELPDTRRAAGGFGSTGR
ncbi:MAG: dUTP diphosphatase [Acidobacteria bacterium]|nr:dUTP diphosphatase [Acidobacteriota bacterium]